MRSARLLTLGALSASLILPLGVAAQAPAATFSATVNVKAYTKTRIVGLTAGKQNLPAGKTLAGWYLSENGTPDPTATTLGWKEAPTTIKLSDEDGLHTVYVWAKAKPGGIVSARGSDTSFLDRVVPVVDSVTTTPAQTVDPAPDPTISSRTVSLSFSFSDPGETASPATGSGVLRYATVNVNPDKGPIPPVPGSTAWKSLPVGEPVNVNHTVSRGNGPKTVAVYVRDRAGNVSEPSSVSFNLVIAGPSVTMVSLTGKLPDPPGTELSVFSKTSKPSIKLVAKNGAGVVLQDAMFLVKTTSDDTPPAAPGSNATGWKTAISTVSLPAIGYNRVWAWAKDVNNSISAVPATGVVVWDNAAPTGTFDITEDTTSDRGISVSATSTDGPDGSGVARYAIVNGIDAPTLSSDWKVLPIPSSFNLPLGNGSKDVSLFLKDNAGNVGGPFTDVVVMTIPAPSLTVTIPAYSKSSVVGVTIVKSDPGGTGINGYFLSETNDAPDVSDEGWRDAVSNFEFSTGDGIHTLYAWVKDKNGSRSSVATDTVLVDSVAPTAVLTYAAGTFTLTGTDNVGGSGIAKYALLRTNSGTIPAAPLFNCACWKDTPAAAILSVTLQATNQVTLYVRDNANNVSEVDVTAPDVNTLVVTVP